MGTNYYARILPSVEQKENLKKLIDENKFDSILEEVQKMYGDNEYEETGAVIHLGKRSGGWKFLFNPNHEKYYPLTKEGLMNFLSREDVIIYNEYFSESYGKYEYTDNPDAANNCEYLWTAKQFMDMAVNWGKKNGWDGESYEKWESENRPGHYYGYSMYKDPHENEWIEKGYKPSYYNFYNDGLRWSTCCDFS